MKKVIGHRSTVQRSATSEKRFSPAFSGFFEFSVQRLLDNLAPALVSLATNNMELGTVLKKGR